MTIRISFSDKTVRVAVEINGAIESAITELPQRTWVGLTKTAVGNHLRRHALGDQPTFRQGFREGVAFAEAKLRSKNT